MKGKFFNYIGQLRIYSLVDLILLLYVAGADRYEFIGALLLHVGFLAYLESRHKHSYRENVSLWLSFFFVIPGAVLYRHIEFLVYLIFSYLYTLKTEKYLGILAPFFRGFQYLFLIGGIMGYGNNLIWLIVFIAFIRNLLGDVRDVKKDKKERLMILPVVFGWKKGFRYIHLLGVLATSFIVWGYSDLTWVYLGIIWAVEVVSYNWTRR